MQVNVFGLGTNFFEKRRDLGQTRQEKMVSAVSGVFSSEAKHATKHTYKIVASKKL